VTAHLAAWWRARSTRERRLAGALGLAVTIAAAALAAEAVVRDAAALGRRIERAERRLAGARMLAGRLEATGALAPDAPRPPLVSLVESAVVGVVGAERLTRLDPGADPEDATEARLAGVDLAEVVRVLGALEEEDPARGLLVRDLELRRRPDEPTRYDATLVVVRRGAS
jgi:hypothetical protein